MGVEIGVDHIGLVKSTRWRHWFQSFIICLSIHIRESLVEHIVYGKD